MKYKWALPTVVIVSVLAVALMILSLVFGEKQDSRYIPPPFESGAQSGTPTVTDTDWTEVYQTGMNFSAHVCGNVVVQNKKADIYFTNDADNTVWLKLRITDADGTALAETGLLKPDEYVKTIQFTNQPEVGTAIKLKIMAYEPDTYYSAGAVTLNTTIGG